MSINVDVGGGSKGEKKDLKRWYEKWKDRRRMKEEGKTVSDDWSSKHKGVTITLDRM